MALLADETKIMLGNLYFGLLYLYFGLLYLYFGLLYVVLDVPLLVSLRWDNILSVLKMIHEVGKC